jgi:hypothetical protein
MLRRAHLHPIGHLFRHSGALLGRKEQGCAELWPPEPIRCEAQTTVPLTRADADVNLVTRLGVPAFGVWFDRPPGPGTSHKNAAPSIVLAIAAFAV